MKHCLPSIYCIELTLSHSKHTHTQIFPNYHVYFSSIKYIQSTKLGRCRMYFLFSIPFIQYKIPFQEFPILCQTCLGDNPYIRMVYFPFSYSFQI